MHVLRYQLAALAECDIGSSEAKLCVPSSKPVIITCRFSALLQQEWVSMVIQQKAHLKRLHVGTLTKGWAFLRTHEKLAFHRESCGNSMENLKRKIVYKST